MKTQILHIFLFSILVSVFCKVNQDTINTGLVNSKVERKIDIASHLVKSTTTVTLENKGSSSVTSFVYAIDPSLKGKLSFIGAVTKSDDTKSDKLKIVKTSVAGHDDKDFYRINIGHNLDAGKSVTLEVETVFVEALKPFPAQITQAEKQLVVLEGNVYYFSPYKTLSQTTTVTTSSASVESYSKSPKPASQSDTTITYGPYEERGPFTEAEMRVHEENNTPFLTVTSMTRIIELSHWGNIAVEEHIDMYHSGATLKGPFSRFDYQRNQDGVSSIKNFRTFLPAAARDIYYRDEIGNISTSNVRETDDYVEVEIRPRFPLFGGWKTHYYIGYNVPSYEYLYNKGDRYALKMRVLDHVYDDMVVDDLTVRVILPEGCKNIELKTPYDMHREDDRLHFTYLDTVGRPVIEMRKTKLVEQHIQSFELHYSFQRLMLLQEPLLVVGAFYLLFLLVIFYVRLDFSITKDEAKESRMRVNSLLEEVQSAQDKRSALYQSYDDAINKFKSSKDNNVFSASRKKIDGDYKQLTQQITNLTVQLKNEGSEASEKVTELQRLDNQYKEQISLAISFAERLIANKINRNQYLDAEAGTSSKREDIYQKMETLRANL